MLSETSPWPPGMRQIKAKPITTLTRSFSLPGAAPHPGPDRRLASISVGHTPIGRGRIYRRRAEGSEIGPSQGTVGPDPRGSDSSPIGSSGSGPLGLGEFGVSESLEGPGLGWPEEGEGKGVFFSFYKSHAP